MAKNLIVVESPTKARTIRSILGREFIVAATMGHIKDLPEKEFGIDVKNGLKPIYRLIRGKGKILKRLKELSKKVEKVLVATDPDREGEAIAWHVVQALKLPRNKYTRITFHEITPSAIRKAIRNGRPIDLKLVEAQQARRVLDRIVGYKISPFLWRMCENLRLSAGRVQSVALRLIVERERERENFKPKRYWEVKAVVRLPSGEDLELFCVKTKNGKTVKSFDGKEEAEKMADALRKAGSVVVEGVKETRRRELPPPPLITSTMQNEANKLFGFSPSFTMRIAQRLYEGVRVGTETVGLITYMRTDSTRISEEAKEMAKAFIVENFGQDYVGGKHKREKVRVSQDAHEAIRPTDVGRTPLSLKTSLSPQELKLYGLIWRRFLASQMAPAQWKEYHITAKSGGIKLVASGKNLAFDGFLKVLPRKTEPFVSHLPKPGETLPIRKVEVLEKQTEPPPRYTEGTLIKELERKGIGRPSTYATVVSTLRSRGYVRVEKKSLVPTELGKRVCDILCERFPDIFDYSFTAKMEDNLEKIAAGEKTYLEIVEPFYEALLRRIREAEGL